MDCGNECYLCMDALAVIKPTQRCHQHPRLLVCVDCYLKIYQNEFKFNCEDCQQAIILGFVENIDQTAQRPADSMTNWIPDQRKQVIQTLIRQYFLERVQLNLEFYQEITRVISKLPAGLKVSDNSIKMLMEMMDSPNQMFSLDQTENLLNLLTDNNSLTCQAEKFLVSRCLEPWSVDVKLAVSGVCYFGNSGIVPGPKSAIELVEQNLARVNFD